MIKLIKKLCFSLASTFFIIMLFCCLSAYAETYKNDDGTESYEYTAYEDYIEITGFSGTATEITIPSEIDGKPVTSIGESSFKDFSNLTSVSIPDSVTSIGDYAFYSCSNLTSVSIPDNVTSIGDYAFYSCSNLTSVSIPDNVTSIGEAAFYHCSSLTFVSIPDSVTSIGDYAFYSCSSLKSISIPDNLSSIGNYAFSICSSLTSVSIPKNVTSIGEYAFWDCRSLKSISIPENITSIRNYTFSNCTSLEEISIPESVTSIGDNAFWNCVVLKSISIPKNVTSIGNCAFESCNKLDTIYYGGTHKQWSDLNPSEAGISSSVKILYTYINEYGKFEYYLYDDYIDLVSFNGSGEIQIPTEIEGIAVTKISNYAFSNLKELTSVSVPDNITIIGAGAFANCDKLDTIYYGGTHKQWSDLNPSEAGISSSVKILYTYINEYGKFEYYLCDDYIDLVSFNGSGEIQVPTEIEGIAVTKISNYAFSNLKELTSVTVPDSITVIGAGAFAICDSLKTVSLPKSITTLSTSIFLGCSSLEEISIPNGVNIIEEMAFYNCNGLKTISIPDSITTFKNSIFKGCSSLEKIYYGGTKEQWKALDTSHANIPSTTKIICNDGDFILVGDINNDNVVNQADIELLYEKVKNSDAVLPIETATKDFMNYIDLDNDGQITATDCSYLFELINK